MAYTSATMSIFVVLAIASVSSASSVVIADTSKSPQIKMVIGMLDGLVSTLDEESAKDEETFTHFSSWCTTQISETGVNIERLQATIEETNALLSHLRAKQGEFQEAIAKLNANIATERQQLQVATEKRNEENTSFVNEQQDFDGAISACGTAAEVLSKHYGDGKEAELEKPSWMAFVSKQIETVRRAAKPQSKAFKMVQLLQTQVQSHASRRSSLRQPNNDRYQASTGEGLTIVDQVGELADTFKTDKQSSVNDENRLQGLFNTLQAEKTEILNTLTAELKTQTGLLTETNQAIADNEGKLARAEGELKNDQAYLARTTQLHKDATDAYNTRQTDRKNEREAVTMASRELQSFVGPSFAQEHSSLQHLASKAGAKQMPQPLVSQLQFSLYQGATPCKKCKKAAALLFTRANAFKSELLQAAAQATEAVGNEAITEIVGSLQKMITQLKQDQRSEDEHKGWCDKELGITNNKVKDHSSIIDHLQAALANLSEELNEEKEDRSENHQTEIDEDNNFDELTGVRKEEHGDFEHALSDTSGAIAALNKAIDILAKFYANRNKFLQVGQAPQGGSVVKLISDVRGEFEHAKTNLQVEEKTAEDEYAQNRDAHVQVDGNIQTDENVIDTSLQVTKQNIETSQDDLGEEKEGKVSTESYLDQLGRSCYMLINNYEDRKKRRAEERDAITEAIGVLEEHA